MKGWKTKTGAVIVAIGAILPLFGVDPAICKAIDMLGAALTAAGLGHKLDKISK